MIMNSSWPPYTTQNPDNPGFIAETIIEAFALSGIEVEMATAPWARCLLLVEQGEAFAVAPVGKTKERRLFGIYSDPIFKTRNPIIFNCIRNKGLDYLGTESLKNKRFGALSGWFYLEDLKRSGVKHQIIADQEMAFRMIAEDRIDITIFDEFAGKHLLENMPELKGKICFSKTPYSSINVHLMASKEFPASRRYVTTFNSNLKKLRKNGFFNKLSEKYHVPKELFLP